MISVSAADRERGRLVYALALALGPAAGGAAGGEPTRTAEPAYYGEYLVKAAFRYNFAKFTEWPSDAYANGAAPLRVCVLGQDPFGTALETIEGKRIKERLVATLRIAWLDQARRCQVLHIGASERDRPGAILARPGRQPILTVTDLPGLAPPGATIDFQAVADKVRFEIDTDHAAFAGLSFSSKLPSLAEIDAGQFGPRISRVRPDG
ncbi:MAG: YfiR family protein [Proteobacteria bacterium]|nr:YfiR family protein [Pseudomonadota bacterium]